MDRREAALQAALDERRREANAIARRRDIIHGATERTVSRAGAARTKAVRDALAQVREAGTATGGQVGGFAEQIKAEQGRKGGADPGGFGARAQAKQGRLTAAMEGLEQARVDRTARGAAQTDALRGLARSEGDISRQLAGEAGDLNLGRNRLNQEDVMSEIKYRKKAGKASAVGGRSEAAGQLLQGIVQAAPSAVAGFRGPRGGNNGAKS
jgi:hypothetical protein